MTGCGRRRVFVTENPLAVAPSVFWLWEEHHETALTAVISCLVLPSRVVDGQWEGSWPTI